MHVVARRYRVFPRATTTPAPLPTALAVCFVTTQKITVTAANAAASAATRSTAAVNLALTLMNVVN